MESGDKPHGGLSDRAFGMTFGIVFLAWFALMWFFTGVPSRWAFTIAGSFLLTATVYPAVLMPINRIWQRIARQISAIINCAVLALIFFGAFWPVAAIMRLIGHDPMVRKLQENETTYFVPVSRQADPETYSDQF